MVSDFIQIPEAKLSDFPTTEAREQLDGSCHSALSLQVSQDPTVIEAAQSVGGKVDSSPDGRRCGPQLIDSAGDTEGMQRKGRCESAYPTSNDEDVLELSGRHNGKFNCG